MCFYVLVPVGATRKSLGGVNGPDSNLVDPGEMTISLLAAVPLCSIIPVLPLSNNNKQIIIIIIINYTIRNVQYTLQANAYNANNTSSLVA